jgi:hypothetical protein
MVEDQGAARVGQSHATHGGINPLVVVGGIEGWLSLDAAEGRDSQAGRNANALGRVAPSPLLKRTFGIPSVG